MSDIPEDIRAAADAVYGLTSFRNPKLHAAIARAIVAERERSALIAEAVDSKRGNEAFIAAAIRNPVSARGTTSNAERAAEACLLPASVATNPHLLPSNVQPPAADKPEVCPDASGAQFTRADGGANITIAHRDIRS